jgi:hypothetical protein
MPKLLGAAWVEHAHDPSHYLFHSCSRFILGRYTAIDALTRTFKPATCSLQPVRQPPRGFPTLQNSHFERFQDEISH